MLTAELPAGATCASSRRPVVVQTRDATVKAERITFDAPQTTCTGAMTVGVRIRIRHDRHRRRGGAHDADDGAATFTREVTSQGISLPHHTHREQGDGQLVSAPQ